MKINLKIGIIELTAQSKDEQDFLDSIYTKGGIHLLCKAIKKSQQNKYKTLVLTNICDIMRHE